MAYRFKLEALRRYRCFQEENLQRALAELERRRDFAAEQLRRVLEQRRRTEAEIAGLESGSDVAAQLALFRSYLDSLERVIAARRAALEESEKACDDKRQELVEAVKLRKTLDKLKENGLKAHRFLEEHEEQKFINEIAVNRFSLKKQ